MITMERLFFVFPLVLPRVEQIVKSGCLGVQDTLQCPKHTFSVLLTPLQE